VVIAFPKTACLIIPLHGLIKSTDQFPILRSAILCKFKVISGTLDNFCRRPNREGGRELRAAALTFGNLSPRLRFWKRVTKN
jgi:hypothetical protein